jgi:aminoglycoside phosphotransferase (APT) family kinase protein
MEEQRLAGGFDRGASLVDGTVRRRPDRWTASVHALLAHLSAAGFEGAPRPLGRDDGGREVLTYLPGTTIGTARPWPAWVHSDRALRQVAAWLREYHRAVADFVPPVDAVWREGGTWRPGLVIAHNDAAPYNAVWDGDGLRGFVDWDMAGPLSREEDLAWVAFSWVPLHARAVVAAEGFTAFAERRARLEAFLAAYGWEGSTDDVVRLVAERLELQVRRMRRTAAGGDRTYQRLLELGRDRELETAIRELDDL